jgi:Rrf2 family protein
MPLTLDLNVIPFPSKANPHNSDQNCRVRVSVRAAIELAATSNGNAVPAERIATSQGIPLNFLEHILSELRVAGVGRSQRGTDGGYRLAKEAGQITIADIIRAVEGPLATVRGGKPEEAEYPGVASQLPRVWIAVRKNL